MPVLLLLWAGLGYASCPAEETIIDDITCFTEFIEGSLDPGGADWSFDDMESHIGGTCEPDGPDWDCDGGYLCGTPYFGRSQPGPEDVYTFTCGWSGSISASISDMSCDMDIYILNWSCSETTGCLDGANSLYSSPLPPSKKRRNKEE